MIKLKSLTLKSRVIQSPMSGCTDLAFRLLARSYGLEFAFHEMVAAEPLVRRSRKTLKFLKILKADQPLGAQLLGSQAEAMGEAAAMLEHMGFDLIDLNLGCPVPKVVNSGSGAALLKEPDQAARIFKAAVTKVKRIPVTVKLRMGYSDPSASEAVLIAKLAEDAGLAAVTVHGRTCLQRYGGRADWLAVAKVKDAVRIPVFGNGDVVTARDAQKLTETSGCDGIMVGRGGLGNPWIYRSIASLLQHKTEPTAPAFQETKDAALKHLELEIVYDGEQLAMLKSRRIMSWYFRNCAGVSAFRSKINQAESACEIRDLVRSFSPL